MEVLYVLLVLLISTRALGELAVRLGQPALLGEIFAGILIGVVAIAQLEALPALAGLPEDPAFGALTDLGIFFLMLVAGLELRPERFASASSRSVGVAIGGLVLPLAIGTGLGLLFLPESELRFARACFSASRCRSRPFRSPSACCSRSAGWIPRSAA